MVFYVEGVGGECKAKSLRCAPDANGRLVSFRVHVKKAGETGGGNKGGKKGKRREREEEKVRVEGTEGEGKRSRGRKRRRREREGGWKGE